MSRTGASAQSGDNFPRSISEITAHWLSVTLGQSVSNLEAKRIGADRGMLGDVFRLTFDSSKGGTQSIIAKFASDREESRASALKAGIFLREISFYREIAHLIESRVPQCFGAWYDDRTAEFLLLLESISFDDKVDQTVGISKREAEMMMMELARLHVPVAKLGVAANSMFPFTENRRLINQKMFIQRGWPNLRNILDEPGEWDTEQLIDGLAHAHRRAAVLPEVFLHGDVRADNLLYSPDRSEVVLVDWQGACLGARTWDLSYFLIQCLTVEDREKWQSDLLMLYCDEVARVTPGISHQNLFVEVESQLGIGAWFPLIVACSLFVVADCTEPRTLQLAHTVAERALHMLEATGEL
jgi:hypothetical protein